MLIVGIDIGSYFTTYAYSYEFENKTFLKSAKYLSGFNLEKVIQDNTVYIIKKLLTLERNTDPVPKNFMFLTEMLTEKDFLNEIKKFVGRIAKIIPVDQDDDDKKYFVVSYPRGLLPKPLSKIYLENICDAITKGIHSQKQYKDAKVYFITDYEALRQCYKEILFKKQKSDISLNSSFEGTNVDLNNLEKKYSKSLVRMNDKDSKIISVDNKDYEKAYEELLDIDSIFNALNDIDVETYKTLYIDFGLKEIRFHYSEFINIIKPVKNTIIDDITDILIEKHLSTFCYNLTNEKQRNLRAQLKEDVKTVILPKFIEEDCKSYQHEFKFEMIHILKITKEMINLYIQNSLLYDVIERIYENANSPIHHIELCGGFANLYYNFLTNYFPNLTIKISNINISVGCVYFQQQLLEKDKLLRNKYRDAKLDCNTQLEKLNANLDEERLSLSFINKEQSDFFHRQQEKQQQLIEKSSTTNDSDWMENVHRKDAKEQEQLFTSLIEKQRVVEERMNVLKDKIKKVQEFSDGLDQYYKSVSNYFNTVSFDFFNSYSIVISSNEEAEEEEGNISGNDEKKLVNGEDSTVKAKELLHDLNLTPTSNNLKGYYFKKLGMAIDSTPTTENGTTPHVRVIGSYTDLQKAAGRGSSSASMTSSSASSTSSQSDNEGDKHLKNNHSSNANNNYSSSIYSTSMCSSLSGISGTGHKPGKNALAILNSKFISFNLQNERLKQKTQLLEENHTLANELKKAQTKNFTLSEELAKVREENSELKSENEKLLQEIESLRQQLQNNA